jgi:hypothetical protein
MKRWILFVVLIVAISTGATIAVQFLPSKPSSEDGVSFPAPTVDDHKPKPKAVVEGELTHKFGTMAQHETGRKTWVVRNEGQAPLELWMVSSTCSCTVAKLKGGKRASVEPGDQTEIALEWETKENSGTYSKAATIGTSDPTLPQFTLGAEGTIRPPVEIYPPGKTLHYMVLNDDKPDHVMGFALYSVDRPDFKITKITSSKPELIVGEVKSITKDELKQMKIEKGHRVDVNVKSGLPLGDFREELIVTTDHPKMPEVRLTVTGKMTGPISVVPEKLLMHPVLSKDGAHREMTLTVSNQRETKFQVFQKPAQVEIAIAPSGDTAKTGRYRMTVTVPPGTPPADIEDWIILKTDNPKAEEIKIPISIIIAG